MNDSDRIREALQDIGYDEPAVRQKMNSVVRGVREDERRACEDIARKNESQKTVDEIAARREH